jgi:hypothetical protein
MSRSPYWTVISSRDVLDASPFLKVRVETIELPDGRRMPDHYQLEMRSFVSSRKRPAASSSIDNIGTARAGLDSCFPAVPRGR